MINLFIMRHGQASFDASIDELRELDSQGIAQVEQVSKMFDLKIDNIMVSPYLRAKQTLEIFNKQRNISVEQNNYLTPESDVLSLIDQLSLCDEQSLMLIGHNPLFSYLANQLTLEDRFSLGTASIVHLQGEVIASGCMSLVREYHPTSAVY